MTGLAHIADQPAPIPQHILRMMGEADELSDRLTKLRHFIEENPIFKTLEWEEGELMVAQRAAMNAYLVILRVRIDRAREKLGIH